MFFLLFEIRQPFGIVIFIELFDECTYVGLDRVGVGLAFVRSLLSWAYAGLGNEDIDGMGLYSFMMIINCQTYTI